tara:strand:+ start:25069 stop:26361 length:1293 start_codon:yes stop_codon:yes gene_type:complete
MNYYALCFVISSLSLIGVLRYSIFLGFQLLPIYISIVIKYPIIKEILSEQSFLGEINSTFFNDNTLLSGTILFFSYSLGIIWFYFKNKNYNKYLSLFLKKICVKNFNKSIPSYNLIADILFLFTLFFLIFFYGNNWLINVRTTGSGTALGSFGRFLFGSLFICSLFKSFIFSNALIKYNLNPSLIRFEQSLKIIKYYLDTFITFIVLNFAGYRGASINAFLIRILPAIDLTEVNKGKKAFKFLFLTLIIISLASLKRIITSGFNPELLFKIGAQADYIEVLSHVNNLLNQNIAIPLISLLNYIPGAFFGVQNRFSLELLTPTDIIISEILGDTYINLGMGFNVGTIHVLYFVFGFIISLFLIFYMGILSGNLSKILFDNQFDPLIKPIVFFMLNLTINLGATRFLLFSIFFFFLVRGLETFIFKKYTEFL